MRLSAVNFIKKSWSKSFNNGIVHNRIGFKSICATVFRQYTELFYKVFTRATESGRSMGGCNFRNFLTINVPNVTEGKFMFFDKKFSKSLEFYYLESGLYPSITDNVEAMNTLIHERHNHSEIFITVKLSRRTQKTEIYLSIERSGLALFSADLGPVFGSNVGNELGVMLRAKDLTNQNLHTLFYDLHRLVWVQYRWHHKSSIAALLSPYFEDQIWRHYSYWTIHELSYI